MTPPRCGVYAHQLEVRKAARKGFDAGEHPRHPPGSPKGGEFRPGGRVGQAMALLGATMPAQQNESYPGVFTTDDLRDIKRGFRASERRAIDDYQQDGYESLNYALRRRQALSDDDAETHEGLEGAFENAPRLPVEVHVWRGVGHGLDDERLVPGALLQDRGYVSTSMDPTTAHTFAGQALMRIRVPAGVKVLPTAVTGNTESELILEPDTTVRLLKVHRVGTLTVLEAEWVPG